MHGNFIAVRPIASARFVFVNLFAIQPDTNSIIAAAA
jgi:hypothetical protein